MNRLKSLGILGFVGALALIASGPVLAQNHGGHGGGGGGAHMSAGGAHFSGGGGHFSGGHYYARPGYGAVGHGYYGGSVRSGFAGSAHYAPRVAYSGGYGRGSYGRGWRGGYWGGRYWPQAGFRSGFSWFLPILPLGFATYWWGGLPYYYYDDAYYTWSSNYNGYVATDPPPVANGGGQSADDPNASAQGPDAGAPGSDSSDAGMQSADVFAYPKNGQSNAQAATDRGECRAWAIGQSGYDPAHTINTGKGSVADYQRAMGACLDARGYSTR